MAAFEDVTYVKLFSDLKIRYEQQRDRENAAKAVKDERVPSPAAFAKERQVEIRDYHFSLCTFHTNGFTGRAMV